MKLILLHPGVASRDCHDCQKYVYDEETGRRAERCGLPIIRPIGTFPPCHFGPDVCPKGSPHAGRELTLAHKQTYEHYLSCQATGTFADDAIVARNAAVIRLVEENVTILQRNQPHPRFRLIENSQ